MTGLFSQSTKKKNNKPELNGEMHSLDSQETIDRLKDEATRAAVLENRKQLELATGTTDVALQSRRAQVIYSIHDLKRKLSALDSEVDNEFINKIFDDINEMTELKVFTE